MDTQKPLITGPPNTQVHAEVLQDVLDAQAKLPPISLDRAASLITGPLMTDAYAEVLQNFMNAQAGLPPVKRGPETWSINGQPYLAISASTFDPTLSNHVTSMPTPRESATAAQGKSQVAVHDEREERAGYIDNGLSRVVRVPGKAGSFATADGQTVDTFTYPPPPDYALIHGHIDAGDHASDGFVDSTGQDKAGYGDTLALKAAKPEPNATVSHGRIGWHVLDNGRLKFLYPAGSMNPGQIEQMQRNLDQEQLNFLRPE